jgi:hypothetical protein
MPTVLLCYLSTCRALTRADRAYFCGRLRFCSEACREKHKATVYRNRAARARFKARQKAAQPVVLVEAPEPLPAPVEPINFGNWLEERWTIHDRAALIVAAEDRQLARGDE